MTAELNIEGLEPIMGEHRVCRGCAGSGLRYDLPSRIRQAIEPIHVPAWIDPVTSRHRGRTIPAPGQLAPVMPGRCMHRITDMRWSVIDCLSTVSYLESMGAEVPAPLFTWDDTCAWCNGSGRP